MTLFATLDGWDEREAVLLSLGLDPRDPYKDFDRKKVRSLKDIPEFRDRMYRLARAVVAFGWHGYILPKDFVVWAKSKNLSLPNELVAAVDTVKPAETFVYREQNPNAIVNKKLELEDAWIEEEKDYELNHLRALYTEDMIKEREARQAEELNPKTRTSLLKMVLGMAIDKYEYGSGKRMSRTASEIQSAVERAGLTIDDDTVRRWLREAETSLQNPK